MATLSHAMGTLCEAMAPTKLQRIREVSFMGDMWLPTTAAVIRICDLMPGLSAVVIEELACKITDIVCEFRKIARICDGVLTSLVSSLQMPFARQR